MSASPLPLQNFQFPLNVYALILERETGAVDYLHYGFFELPGESVAVAQQRSTDMLLARLPSPPADLLEVGIGTGSTLNTLLERGYRVTGIGPEPEQLNLARHLAGDRAVLECTGFEEFMASPGSFDAILLQESFQYLDAGDLFSRGREMLRPGGVLLLADEFLQGAPEGATLHLPDLEATRRLAASHGLRSCEEVDVTEMAAPTVDYLLERIAAHHPALLELPDVGAEGLAGLVEALEEYRRAYAAGWCRYRLWHLERD